MASLTNAITTQRARLGRVLLAASASTLMTCVVALPMAYQAQAARAVQSVNQPVTSSTTPRSTISTLPPASVLGATTIAESESMTPAQPSELAEAPTTTPRKPASPRTTAPSGSPGATTPADPPVTPLEEPTTAPTITPQPSSSVPAPTTTEVRSSPEGLRGSLSDSLSDSFPLLDAQVSKPIFVFLDASVGEGISQVRFFLDGEARATDHSSPWELLEGRSLDPTRLSTGQHTVRAEITFGDGRTLIREAKFSKL